jgi:hypothetical protein
VVVAFTPRGVLDEVFFPETGELWTWRDGKFNSTLAARIENVTAIHDGELTLNGVPVRLRNRVQSVSQMGEGWWVAYGEERLFAIRDEQVYELPEDAA